MINDYNATDTLQEGKSEILAKDHSYPFWNLQIAKIRSNNEIIVLTRKCSVSDDSLSETERH